MGHPNGNTTSNNNPGRSHDPTSTEESHSNVTRSQLPVHNTPQAFPPPESFPPGKPGAGFPQPQAFPPQAEPVSYPPPQQVSQQPNMAQFTPPVTNYSQQPNMAQFTPPVANYSQQPNMAQFTPRVTNYSQQPNMAQFTPPGTNYSIPGANPGTQFGQNYAVNNNYPPGIPIGNIQPPGIILSTEPWQSSLFDCMDDPENALITACVPCVTFGQIAEIIDQGQTSCGTSGAMYGLIAFFIGAPCIMSCGYRTKLRAKLGLIESPAPDWIVHCFCDCCALCQEYRELKKRGMDPAIGWQTMQHQQQQQQMVTMTPPINPMMGR